MRMAVGRVGVVLAASVIILQFCQVACTAVAATACLSNKTCPIANAHCGSGSNSMCACNPGYIDKPEGSCSSVLGSQCANNAECSAVNFTECSSHACQCVAGYHNSSGNPALCTNVTITGSNAGTQTCKNSADCSQLPNSECTGEGEKKCTCKSGYTMQGNACHTAPDGHCAADTDCVEDATCSKNTQKCQCKEKYEAKDGLCVESGATAWLASIWLVSLLAIGVLQ